MVFTGFLGLVTTISFYAGVLYEWGKAKNALTPAPSTPFNALKENLLGRCENFQLNAAFAEFKEQINCTDVSNLSFEIPYGSELFLDKALNTTELKATVENSLSSWSTNNTQGQQYLDDTALLLNEVPGCFIGTNETKVQLEIGNTIANLPKLKDSITQKLISNITSIESDLENLDTVYDVLKYLILLSRNSSDYANNIEQCIKNHTNQYPNLLLGANVQAALLQVEEQENSLAEGYPTYRGYRYLDFAQHAHPLPLLTRGVFSYEPNCVVSPEVLNNKLLVNALYFALTGNVETSKFLVETMVDWDACRTQFFEMKAEDRTSFIQFLQSKDGVLGFLLDNQHSQITENQTPNTNLTLNKRLRVPQTIQHLFSLNYFATKNQFSSDVLNKRPILIQFFVSHVWKKLAEVFDETHGTTLFAQLDNTTQENLINITTEVLKGLAFLGQSSLFDQANDIRTIMIAQNTTTNHEFIKPYETTNLIPNVIFADKYINITLANNQRVEINGEFASSNINLKNAYDVFKYAYEGSSSLREALWTLKSNESLPYKIYVRANATYGGSTYAYEFTDLNLNENVLNDFTTCLDILIHEFAHNVQEGPRYKGNTTALLANGGQVHDKYHTMWMARVLSELVTDYIVDVETDYSNDSVSCGVVSLLQQSIGEVLMALDKDDFNAAVIAYQQLDQEKVIHTLIQEPQSLLNINAKTTIFESTTYVRQSFLETLLGVALRGKETLSANYPASEKVLPKLLQFMDKVKNLSLEDEVAVDNAKRVVGLIRL